jgi:MoaA/NifB/PqqE/SkfB family radical SAM enzyme
VVGSDAESNDDVVRGVYYSAKADLKKAAAKGLPTQATITIKRDNNKTIIDKEKLRD